MQAVGIPVAGLEPESQPLIEFFTPLITVPGAHGDAALAVFRDAARLGGAYAALLQAEVQGEGKRSEDTLRYLSQLCTVYSPLLAAVRPPSAPVDLVSPPSADAPFAVSSNFAAPPPRRIKPEGDAPLLTPSALLSLLRLTLSDAPFAALARAVASAASRIDAAEVLSIHVMLWRLLY